jgi:hypothetical protein
MTALEYFRLLAPEFSSVPDATVSSWLTVAGNLIATCPDPERAAMALALYAAHMLKLSLASGNGASAAQGAVTSEREGDLQRTYGEVKGGDTWLGQSTYGQQYLDVTRGCFGAGIMTRVAP